MLTFSPRIPRIISSQSFLLILLSLRSFSILMAQDNTFIIRESGLTKLSSQIWSSKTDSGRIAVNTLFFNEFKSVLQLPGAFSYPFDSLKDISRITSDDHQIRILTWNIPLKDGSSQYYGFLESEGEEPLPLEGKSKSIPGWQNRILARPEWYGAIYYRIINSGSDKNRVYTVLGWDGHDQLSNYKIIDAITFDSNGNPSFGSPVFKTAEGIKNRVIIEYAKNATAVLRYDYQGIMIKKGHSLKKKMTWMIVLDRLIPMDPSMAGNKKYYVPAGDSYDGYYFNDGKWIFVEDVAVENAAPQK